jgi:polysaccharide biosynthesis PFTS motif protein
MINIPVISLFIGRHNRNRLRGIWRGYRSLKRSGELELLRQLKDVLTKTKLNNTGLSKSFFCQGDFDIELSIRQYLTVRILGLSFNKSILYSVGSNQSLSHPLPKEWRDALISQGINVNNFKSAFLWHAYSFLLWGVGVLRGLKSIYFLLVKYRNLGGYVYFDSLSRGCLSKDRNRKNIINWYLQWKGRVKSIDNICHSFRGQSDYSLDKVKIVQADYLPYIKGIKLFQYVIFIMYAIAYSFLNLFFRPIYSLFVEEVIKLKRVELANNNELARDCLFNSTMPFYRPIWTYAATNKGTRILYYDYSTNHGDFKTKDRYPIQDPWHLMSWPYYLVWDEFHANFIKRHDQHNPKIENVGHIWFSSSGKCTDIPLNSIAVFDVPPSKFAIYMYSSEYYNYNVVNQFLSDVQLVLNKNNIGMVHKSKRTKKFEHKRYVRRIRQLSKELNFTKIYPDVDALQVIQKTKACISMPFTSTAIIAKQEGRPSVYYDPVGIIQKDDRAAHDIPVLSGINELEDWVDSINNGMSQ